MWMRFYKIILIILPHGEWNYACTTLSKRSQQHPTSIVHRIKFNIIIILILYKNTRGWVNVVLAFMRMQSYLLSNAECSMFIWFLYIFISTCGVYKYIQIISIIIIIISIILNPQYLTRIQNSISAIVISLMQISCEFRMNIGQQQQLRIAKILFILNWIIKNIPFSLSVIIIIIIIMTIKCW